MKKTIKVFLAIGLTLFFLTSCATSPEQRACYQIPPEQSKLCNLPGIGDYWEETNLVMRISNAAMIQEGVYSARQALDVVNNLDAALDAPGGAMYGVFFKLVADKAGPLVAITINESIDELVNLPEVITPFDKALLKKELARHRFNIELFIAVEEEKDA